MTHVRETKPGMDALDTALGVTFPASDPGSPSTTPAARADEPAHRLQDETWAVEADHRLRNLAQLALAAARLDRSADSPDRQRCADRLAGTFTLIEASGGTCGTRERLPCADTLRTLAEDLVSLFGPTIGAVRLETAIDEMWLETSRRRAVLLIASEWIINALRHAFTSANSGSISVSLSHAGGVASLRVGDDGCGASGCGGGTGSRIVSTLAALARGSVRRSALSPAGTCMELRLKVGEGGKRA